MLAALFPALPGALIVIALQKQNGDVEAAGSWLGDLGQAAGVRPSRGGAGVSSGSGGTTATGAGKSVAAGGGRGVADRDVAAGGGAAGGGAAVGGGVASGGPSGARACFFCNARKKKCDMKRPCQACKDKNIECHEFEIGRRAQGTLDRHGRVDPGSATSPPLADATRPDPPDPSVMTVNQGINVATGLPEPPFQCTPPRFAIHANAIAALLAAFPDHVLALNDPIAVLFGNTWFVGQVTAVLPDNGPNANRYCSMLCLLEP